MSPQNAERLPLSFHMTFQPERQYLSALLNDARYFSGGTVSEISARTGIPTGESTGKVRPLVQYAQGMGLLEVKALRGKGRLQLALTPLARSILSEDPHLLEENTQWALHLMLCRRHYGAEAWHAVFVDAAMALGRAFTELQFEEFLTNRYGSSRDAVGPLLRTYSDAAALSKAAAIQRRDGKMFLRKVPMQPALHDTLGALLFLTWDMAMPGDTQAAFRELEAYSGLIIATGWNLDEQCQFLGALESAGLVRVDRQTGAPILTRLVSVEHVLKVMYDRLV